MYSMKRMLAVLAATVLWAGAANAQSIVWDQGPGTGSTVGGSWVNETGDQNFADSVLFRADTLVGGINYFTNFDLTGQIGASDFHVKILADSGGAPGAVLWQWDQGFNSISRATPHVSRLSFSFAPKLFAADTTYWVGVSGNGFEAAQLSVVAPGDGQMAQFQGATYVYMASVGDQMFQLTTPVPEPETYAMMMAGLSLLGALARRRKQQGLIN